MSRARIDDLELAYRRGFDHGVHAMAVMLKDGLDRFDLDEMAAIARKMRLSRREVGRMSFVFIDRCFKSARREKEDS